jgi:hypothetical protein
LAEVARGCLSDLDSVALIMLRHFAAILFVIPTRRTAHSGARVFARTRHPDGEAGREIVLDSGFAAGAAPRNDRARVLINEPDARAADTFDPGDSWPRRE